MSKVISTRLSVDAPVDAVWQTLTDLSAYHLWNPFITAASGTFSVGEQLDLTIHPPGGRPMSFRPRVTARAEHRYLEWLGRLGGPGIFDGRHSFTLTATADGRTLLEQSETFVGLMVPFTGSMLTRTQAGFAAMNQAVAGEATRLAELHPGDVHN
jgi:hypothetical protein